MKKFLQAAAIVAFMLHAKPASSQATVTVFDDILFYDGYAALVDQPVPDGVIRHRNDLYARKLSDDELASLGNTLTINVTIGAACDNYDRIGNVNMAFVPKGAATYVPDEVQRIELARFITPFMNKNITPTDVPYTWTVDNAARILKDPEILAAYDIWMELQVFGVPYAAQTQVAGCAGRNDVFYGTLELVSDGTFVPADYNYIMPLDFQHNLNNYQEGATDEIGTTVRTISFDLPADVNDAYFYLITSNHGSNSGGEEYNRRFHYIYLDDVLKLQYKPGGVSCEPYRVYNTQPNGIYGSSPQSFAYWASFSNWCPGQIIPIRTISLGNLTAGTHTFKIAVPTAVFNEQQGYIPVSVYLQGTTQNLGTQHIDPLSFSIYPNPATNDLTIQSAVAPERVIVQDMLGKTIIESTSAHLDVSSLARGMYLIKVDFGGKSVAKKFVKK